MRIAAIYDIHGNLPALEAVLDDVRRAGVDHIVIGGDVMPGPMSNEALARLLALDLPTRFIHGNGESAVLACLAGRDITYVPEQARATIRWTAEHLRPEHARTIAAWPSTLRIDAWPGDVLFCHATPRSDTELFTSNTDEGRLADVFREAGASLVVCGHTHMQFDRVIGGVRVVNAGSAGMPFGPAGADWLLLGPDVELRHTAYDLDAAAARIRATDYPGADVFAERNVLNPPAQDVMLELYAKAESKRPAQ